MPRGSGVSLNGQRYNVVQDHETYVVADVPAHPDADSRMERRVHYDSWVKGYLKRRASNSPQDQSIVSLNIYNRIERPGDGLWFSYGGDTRMGDRIFGQRQVGLSQPPASMPVSFQDSSLYSFITCVQHVYSITGLVGSTQQILLSKDFSAVSPTVNITDSVAFNGRIYVATCQLTNGVPDPSLPQPMWAWDQTTTTTNWVSTIAGGDAGNGLVPLDAPTFPNQASTTVAVQFTNSFVGVITVGSTAGMPGGAGGIAAANFNVNIDNEILTVHYASATTLTIITRGVFGTPSTAHNTGAKISYVPGGTIAGTGGQARWQYYVITKLAGRDSPPSFQVNIVNGASSLTTTNYNVLIFNTVSGQTYTVFRSYAGGNPNSVGIIGDNIPGATDGSNKVTFNDTGLPVTGLQYQITPQFAIGDVGRATSFAVIRNVLWRAAGPRMWSWDGAYVAWSGESVIGDPNANITALDVYQDALVIFKQDGIFTMNRTGDVFSLFPGFKTLGLNARPLGQWKGNYYFASDVGMVWEWNGDVINSIGFDYAEAYPFPDGTFGLPNAVTRGIGLPNYFLVGFQKFNSHNNAAFFFAYDGVGWHPFHYDPNYVSTGLGFTGGNQLPANPTIQFGKGTWNGTSYAISYLTSPTLDPYLVTNYDTTPQVVFLPVDSGIIADEWKVLEGLRLFVENSTSGLVRVAYASDDNIFLQQYVDMGPPQNDRTTIQTFVFGASTQLPVYRKIMFRITLTPDANNATPIIRLVMHRYKQRETQRKSWTMALFLEEGQMNPNSNREHRTSKQMLKHLNDARKERNLVDFVDLVGDKYKVYVESVGESLKTYRGASNTTSFVAKVVLVEPAEVANE